MRNPVNESERLTDREVRRKPETYDVPSIRGKKVFQEKESDKLSNDAGKTN